MTENPVHYTPELMDLMRSGYIEIWCFTCDTSRLHAPIKVVRGRWSVNKKTSYKCGKCGTVRDWKRTGRN